MSQPVPESTPDGLVIQQLGAAVLLCLHELPFVAQTAILAQADDAIGTVPTPEAKSQIVKLLLRRAPSGFCG
jgi:hypothetical protein